MLLFLTTSSTATTLQISTPNLGAKTTTITDEIKTSEAMINPTSAAIPSVFNSMAPLSEFTLFPDLPVEIRRKIWNWALPAPQVVSLDSSDILFDEETSSPSNLMELPVLLFINRESRTEVLSEYGVFFRPKPVILGNYDTLQLPGRDFINSISGCTKILDLIDTTVPGGCAAFQKLQILNMPSASEWSTDKKSDRKRLEENLLRFTGLSELHVFVTLISDTEPCRLQFLNMLKAIDMSTAFVFHSETAVTEYQWLAKTFDKLGRELERIKQILSKKRPRYAGNC